MQPQVTQTRNTPRPRLFSPAKTVPSNNYIHKRTVEQVGCRRRPFQLPSVALRHGPKAQSLRSSDICFLARSNFFGFSPKASRGMNSTVPAHPALLWGSQNKWFGRPNIHQDPQGRRSVFQDHKIHQAPEHQHGGHQWSRPSRRFDNPS